MRKLKTFAFLLRRSVVGSFDDGCFGIAKGAAYSALLSFFPVLTSAATILVQTRADFVSNTIEKALSEIVPPGSEDLVLQQFRITGERPLTVLIVAGLISLWAASSVIKSLIEGFHAAYRVPRNRSFLRQSGVAMSLVLICAIPLLCAALLILFGGQIERAAVRLVAGEAAFWDRVSGVWALLGRLARYALAFLTTFTVAACLYFIGPYRRQRWKFIWPGATIAAALWVLATYGFGWYVRTVADYNVMYGSIGAGIALLVWMYLLAVTALIGCEFNAAYERSAKV